MFSPTHSLQDLFAQLGLPSGAEAVERFIETHRPLPADQRLVDAPFWNKAQRQFLREAFNEDADWAEPVDELDALLRHAG